MNVALYSLILVNPTIDRLDTLVGEAVVQSALGWDVRLANSTIKMQAIDPSFPPSKLLQFMP